MDVSRPISTYKVPLKMFKRVQNASLTAASERKFYQSTESMIPPLKLGSHLALT